MSLMGDKVEFKLGGVDLVYSLEIKIYFIQRVLIVFASGGGVQ